MPHSRTRAASALVAALTCLVACSAPEADTTASTGASGGASTGASTGASGTATAGASQASGTLAGCDKASLQTHTAGRLTIGTDSPAYEPWFNANNPGNGKGYESAVAFALAKKLGYATSDVSWVVVPFNTAIAPAAKSFDLDLNEISISDARRKAVDFSSGYYDVRQAVITYKGSPIDGKTTIAALQGATLGAQVGSTSYDAITQQIKPSHAPKVFDTNDLAVQALKNHQLDGIVVDLPTAFYMISQQLGNGVIVGQLPQGSGTPEQFGAVLDKGSPLTSCVSKAVVALRADGTLAALQKQWLTSAGAPELT